MKISNLFKFLFPGIAMLFLWAPLHADVLGEIQKQGKLVVGVSLFEPWTMESESGELYGFEVDVASKIAEDMGVEPEFRLYEWKKIIPALIEGEIDLIAGGMAINPQRALKVNFSQPYARSGITMTTNTSKTQDVNQLEDLNQPDFTIAVVAETTAEQLVNQLFGNATKMAVQESADAAKAVLSGSVHAYVASFPQPEFLALTHPGKLDIPLSRPLLIYQAGLAVQKGEQEWLNFLNSWIVARKADRWLSTVHEYWFETLDWK